MAATHIQNIKKLLQKGGHTIIHSFGNTNNYVYRLKLSSNCVFIYNEDDKMVGYIKKFGSKFAICDFHIMTNHYIDELCIETKIHYNRFRPISIINNN